MEAGAKTIVLGPGSLEQAHTVDEFVPREQLLQAVACYRALACEMLGAQQV